MPPRRGPSQHIYELGQQGRKTGVTLPDTGARDEHGFQPLDGLFGSPRKAETPRVDQTGEVDMELEASGPGPSTVLAAQKSARLQIPHGRSPAKTNLQSPPVRIPHFSSSPTRGSVMRSEDTDGEVDDRTVTRRLDLRKAQPNGTRGRKADGPRRSTSRVIEEEEGEEDLVQRDEARPGDDDSMQLVQDSPPPAGPEPEGDGGKGAQEERPKPGRRGRPPGRPKKAPPKEREPSVESEANEPEAEQQGSYNGEDEEAPQPRRKPGRPAKKAAPSAATKQQKRASPEEEDEEREGGDKKRQKTQEKASAPAKKPGRKPKAKPQAQTEDPDTSVLQVQRGPPLPRARGLVSMRRDSSIQQTRSGRHSYRPLEFWKNERVEYETDAVREDMFRAGSRMVLPSIKEVIRVEEEEVETKKRNSRPRGRTKGKKKAQPVEEEEEEEEEEWEREVGSVVGDVVVWEPEHELNPPGADDHVEVMESRLAVSSGAVQTHDIRGTTFQFAKTLNLSFMGTGVVDMPPGSEKKPKNSRKMQMVFFVFKGKVLVSVNETEFRISTGGQWFVPRGNYYSIKNDSDRPARLFFAQACEVMPTPPQEE